MYGGKGADDFQGICRIRSWNGLEFMLSERRGGARGVLISLE